MYGVYQGKVMLSKWVGLGLLCVAIFADASEVKLHVGASTLRYEMPGGYVRASVEAPPLFQYLEAAMPPANRLVEAFYTPADIQTLLAGGGTAKDTYFMVQAIRSLEAMTVSHDVWQGVLSQATAEMGRLDVNAVVANDTARNQRMSDAAGKSVQMEFGKIATPQVYARDDHGARFLMLIPVTVSFEGQPLNMLGVCAGALVLVGNKPLLVYAYRASSTARDIDAAKRDLGTAVGSLLALNSAEAATTKAARAVKESD